MLRPIDGFHQDELGDWVAELRCGHGQHVRHKPPFWSLPWVQTPEGRSGKVGTDLPCPLCDRFEMPAGYAPYKRTPEFTAGTIPDGLRRDHSTKPGVWALLHVLEGRLQYIVEPPLASERIVEAGDTAVIVAEVLHRVAPASEVRFFVEFYRRPS